MVFSRHTRRELVGLALLLGITMSSPLHASSGCDPQVFPFFSGGQNGFPGPVSTVTEWNGDLIAGGLFTTAGGQTVNRIARWDGSAWHPLSSGGQIGVGGDLVAVNALTVWNGDLIAGGIFETAGGQTVNNIARWDGSAWHPFIAGSQTGVGGTSFPAPGVNALTVWNGNLVAAGFFTTAGGQTVNKIARWDGSAWHPFSSGGQNGVGGISFPNLKALTVWNGDLIAGGGFTTAGGQMVNYIARWDGSAWHPFTSGGQIGLNEWVHALTVWNGDLIAGGEFTTAHNQAANHIARWDGSAWNRFISNGQVGMNNWVFGLTVWNGDLIAGGSFLTAGGQTVNRIARWDGSLWRSFINGAGTGVNSWVDVLAEWNGDLIAGGDFVAVGGQFVNRIARWHVNLPGACCINGVAIQTFANDCAVVGGVFFGAGVASGDVECVPFCPGDLNGDGVVDLSDLLMLLSVWGFCP